MDPNKSVPTLTGLEYFKALIEGTVPRAPMLELFDINFDSAEPGAVVLTATPTTKYYSPLGFVHGGYAAVLLDSCMAAAIVTSLEPSLSAVTLEYKINFVKPMSADTGMVRGEGKSLYIGRQMAIAEGRLLDAAGESSPTEQPPVTLCAEMGVHSAVEGHIASRKSRVDCSDSVFKRRSTLS